MALRPRTRVYAAVVAASFSLSACALPGASKQGLEGTINTDGQGNVALHLAGRAFALKTADGQPLGTIQLQVGGVTYTAAGGSFNLPASALNAAKANGGTMRIFAPGYVPQTFSASQSADSIVLIPAKQVALAQNLPYTGGKLAAADGAVDVTLGSGLLKGVGTNVALSTYVPAADTADQTSAAAKLRSDFLAKVAGQAGGSGSANGGANASGTGNGGSGSTNGSSGGSTAGMDACGAPLPCPPAVPGVGLLVTVDGPVGAGPLTAHFDLGNADYATNPAVQQIVAAFAAIDARPDAAAFRAELATDYGIKLENNQLTFTVTVGSNAVVDGLAKVEVDGFELLGGKVEVTVVSAASTTLPDAASVPSLVDLHAGGSSNGAAGGNASQAGAIVLVANDGSEIKAHDGEGKLISQDGATIISQDGGSLISQDGGSIVAQGGGNLISQDGGSIVAQGGGNLISQDGGSIVAQGGGNLISNDGGTLVGKVEVPFAPPNNAAKYSLQFFTSYVWPGQARVYAYKRNGQPYYFPVDDTGHYTITGIPKSGPALFVIAEVGGKYRAVTIAEAPRQTQVTADMDAATTGMALLALDEKGVGVPGLNLTSFKIDVAAVRPLMSQSQAKSAMTLPYKGVSWLMQLLLAILNFVLACLSLPASVPAPPPGTSTAIAWLGANNTTGNSNAAPFQFSSPTGLTLDGMGNLYVSDTGNGIVRRVDPTGTSIATLPGTLATAAATTIGGGLLYATDGASQLFAQTASGGPFASFSGQPTPGYATGGATASQYGHPAGLTYDATRMQVLVADTDNDCIRAVQPGNGTSSNLAGQPGTAGRADGGPGTATLNHPTDVQLDAAGVGYIADRDNNGIRTLSQTNVLGSLCGNPGGTAGLNDGSGNGTKFDHPSYLAVDNTGSGTVLYVSDTGNNTIRKVVVNTATVTTLHDATGTNVEIPSPKGIAIDSANRMLYVAGGNHQIFKVLIP